MFLKILYHLFVFLALFGSLMVVVSKKAIYSSLFLILTMLTIASLFVLMNAQLAAALQIIVYAGAIMVLFLFVIMLLNLGKQASLSRRSRPVRWLGLLFGVGIGAQIIAVIYSGFIPPAETTAAASVTIDHVARLILTDYLYAFEMISVLLLVAVVGAVVLARRYLIQGTETVSETAEKE
jgi:NADH-quinone oxidoreductase subunit J